MLLEAAFAGYISGSSIDTGYLSDSTQICTHGLTAYAVKRTYGVQIGEISNGLLNENGVITSIPSVSGKTYAGKKEHALQGAPSYLTILE